MNDSWKEVIHKWRALPEEEKKRRRLRNIPRNVADSMAMAGEPVDLKMLVRAMAVRYPEVFPEVDIGQFTTARFTLYGQALPRIEEAVRMGECLRAAMMSKAKQLYGEQAIPAVLSGHDLALDNRHGHAFYLPEDADGDGRIDHLVIHVSDGLDPRCCRVLDGLSRLWMREGMEWQTLLEGIGAASAFSAVSKLLAQSHVWQSVTPYLHPWFVKKKFTSEDQLRRESRERGLPEITQLECLPAAQIGDRESHALHFHRFRSKRNLMQPDKHGSFWCITFAAPVQGPLAFGFGCHFGLGVFEICGELIITGARSIR